MNKPLSLEQLDHVCLIAERLVDCNNAVSENYHTNMLISKASKDYRCTDKLKTQLRLERARSKMEDSTGIRAKTPANLDPVRPPTQRP